MKLKGAGCSSVSGDISVAVLAFSQIGAEAAFYSINGTP
jgi:hypothetical protein